MVLWTDLVDPAYLTGYARRSLADYEASRGTLARWLPNREVQDVVAQFRKGQTGLVDIADWRAYDAEPKLGKAPEAKRVTIELPAIGRNIPVSEYNQLRMRNSNPSDDAVIQTIENTTDLVVRAVSDAIERLRGVILQTGKATVSGFMDDDFGRVGGHTVTAATPWSTTTVDALNEVQGWMDTYLAKNGVLPGAAIMSTRVLRSLTRLDQFETMLANQGTRPATAQQVQDTWVAAGLPPIYLYDRQVSIAGVTTKVVTDDRIIFAPAPVDPNDGMGTELGATFWGRTLTSIDPEWALEDADQPGLVAGVYRNPKPPMIAEVISDAIALPVLANPDLTFVADVL